MQLFVFFVLLLLTFAESSNVESGSDLLSSVDIIAFKYSLDASEHWDCPRVGDRAAKAEEARVWQTVIPDARIEEIAIASGSRALQKAEQYKWINKSSSDTMQNRALLGMRRPDSDSSTATVKVLYSKSKQVNKDALSVMLPQLEQSKDRILEWMARDQVSISSVTPKTTDPFTDRFQVPQATNYHPRAFKHPHFTTSDLVAGMVLAAESRQKGHADAFKFFKLMVRSFLPSFSVNLGAVPADSAGKPTKTVYLHRSFQYVPAGADFAFYFDGNRGRFLKIQEDSIMLNRPEGIVDGQQHAALILSSNASVDASSFKVCQTKADIAVREAFCEQLKKALVVHAPSEVQVVGVSTIRSSAARLERDSFLEAQRRGGESRPTLLAELLPAKLVRLVIDYFSDDTYPFIVSTHRWSLKDMPGIAVDSARVYVVTKSEGIRGLSHSSASLKEDERRCTELGHPHWVNYLWFTSSCDGRYISFSHLYQASTNHRGQTGFVTKWFIQNSGREDEGFKGVVFDGESMPWGLLSRDGQTLFSCNVKTRVTRVFQIKKGTEKSPTAFTKFKFDGMVRAVSGKGNRIIVANAKQLEIHDVGEDATTLVCEASDARLIRTCALNENGSEAAFVDDSSGEELRIMEVDRAAGDKADQPAVITVPESLGEIYQLVYSVENKLHARHLGGKVSLFDPSTKTLIPIEIPQEEQKVASSAISPSADYFASLQYVDNEGKSGRISCRTIVKRKLGIADLNGLFGYVADKVTDSL